MSASKPKRREAPRYRTVAYELDGDRETVVMDATGQGFLAVVGTIAGAHMNAEVGRAGPVALLEHIALMIANDQAV